jgi:hypothetical protein
LLINNKKEEGKKRKSMVLDVVIKKPKNSQ